MKKQLHIYEDELETESFGIYKNYYNFENSDLYKQKLDEIKKRQKEMVRNRMATNHSLRYEVDGSSDKGKEFILDTIKLSLKAFNNECSNFINKAKFNNVVKIEEKMNRSFEEINSLTDMQKVSIKREYLDLKIEERRNSF